MNAQEAATLYVSRGWPVVPLRPQSKMCVDESNWLTKTYTPDDINPTGNIGIKWLGGLLDIDCDCSEVVLMAEAFLPRTQAVYGRPSRPKSHWLFRCPEIKEPIAYKDLVVAEARKRKEDTGDMGVTLIEIRVNHQSMAPPSIHPSGEQVRWDTEGPELAVDKPLLVRSVQLCATGAMIARYYNPPGDRHDWGIALAGFLRKLNISQLEAERLLTYAAKWVKDDKVKDRLDAIKGTYTLSEDAPATGAKRLAELMGQQGPDFVATLYKIWGAEGGGVSKTKLEALNQKHAVLFRQGGKLVVLTEEHEDGKLQLRYTTRADFNLLYPGKVQTGVTNEGKPIFSSLAEAWLTHPKRRFYRGIELAPNGHSNEGYYNLWQGFTVEPKKGKWPLFREHLMTLVQNNEDHYHYIVNWMAETVQHPERPIGIALAFKGKQGTGKSTAATWFGELFGNHFMHLDSEHRLLGQFNNHLHNAIVVFADEAVWAGGKAGLGALKRMITERTLAIEPKGLDVINAKNMIHMLIASNEDWMVPTGFDNRRFAVFEAGNEHIQDHKFFGAVYDELFKHEGLAALLYDLKEHPRDVDLRRIPDTEELARQKKHSMNAKQAWWYEQLQSGAPWQGAVELPAGDGLHQAFEVDPDLLYSAYVTALKMGDNRVSPGFQASLSRFLKTMVPSFSTTQHAGKRFWIIPGLDECRAFFDQETKMRNNWPIDPDQKTLDVPF